LPVVSPCDRDMDKCDFFETWKVVFSKNVHNISHTRFFSEHCSILSQNLTLLRFHFIPVRMATTKKKIINAGEDGGGYF
jgi:hypothetical protein